jgi:hypothetical protein
MGRRAAIAAALTVAAIAVAAPTRPSKPTPTLHVRAIDRAKRSVLIEISGVTRVPPPNYFTFTDERARKFVAANIHCEEPFPSGTRACDLEMPAGYEKHRPMSLIAHLRGLHDKPIVVEDAELASAWAAAIANVVTDGGVP